MPINSGGYVYETLHGHPLADKRGRVLQHRRIWFEANGPIPDGLIVHHINEDKTDNRLKNLELCSRSKHMVSHYPDGFNNIPWNKGSAKYTECLCSSCGKTFVRLSKDVRNSERRGYRLACSHDCARSLPKNKGGV